MVDRVLTTLTLVLNLAVAIVSLLHVLFPEKRKRKKKNPHRRER